MAQDGAAGMNARDAGSGQARAGRWRRCGRALVLLSALLPAWPALAQDAAPAEPAPAPGQIDQLLDLLADPAVRAWLAERRAAPAADAAEAAAAAPAAPEPDAAAAATPEPAPAPAPGAMAGPSRYMVGPLDAIRAHLAALKTALPELPAELRRAGATFTRELEAFGLGAVLLLVAGFAGFGLGAQWLYARAVRGALRRLVALPLGTVGERLHAMGFRLLLGAGAVVAFALGSIGAFLAFDWPPLLREIVLGYLGAFLALRLALTAERFVIAPGAERFRILPITTEAAWFWHRRLWLSVGWFALGWVTIELLGRLGMAPDGRRIVAYLLGLVLLAIGLESVWRRPRAWAHPADAAATGRTRLFERAGTILLSLYLVLLYLLWVVNAMALFWLAVVAVCLPAAMVATQRGVDHILRPPEAAAPLAPDIWAASVGRGLRALLMIGAAIVLARVWQLDMVMLTAGDTMTTRLLRGALNAAVILLVADFVWHVLRAVIDRRIALAQAAGPGEGEEARRQARLRTLLPILRNMLLVVLVVMAALMALSALGIQIAPLIAGAGVVGVAIGFGAQTLVKDIISGMFYLLDDAFRVGEYVQSGSYRGTVESFSLRSVKLRHHRGPLYTVPFGELGAIQNMSRDWVIDKLTISLTYDTDLDKAKKLIKQVGRDLLAAPDLAPHIIETLKMQGVEQFGDFAIQVRLKMMTKPGEQFVIRRRAYAMIKKAFDANGISFAFPTVQVAGNPGEATAAVARQGLELVQPPPAAL
jgi:small-conductance mechanosensitive channel